MHNFRRALGVLPLPAGERVGVRGFGFIESLKPLTPSLSAEIGFIRLWQS
jgi:hypothetical protein